METLGLGSIAAVVLWSVAAVVLFILLGAVATGAEVTIEKQRGKTKISIKRRSARRGDR